MNQGKTTLPFKNTYSIKPKIETIVDEITTETPIQKKHSNSEEFYKWFYGDDISILDIKDKTYGNFIDAYNVKFPHKVLVTNNTFKDQKLDVYKYPKELFQKSVYDLFGVEKGNIEDPGVDAIWYNLLPTIFINGPYRSYNNGVVYYDDDKQIPDLFIEDSESGSESDVIDLDGGGRLYPASPLSELRIGGKTTDIFFLSLPNQKEKGELEKLFGLMKEFGIKDIINFQSCAGILQSKNNDEQVSSWHMEFYNPNRPEQWSNCQYIPTKFNNGQQVDIYGRILPLDTIERIKTLLKDPNGNEKVDLQDMVWTGNKKTFFDDHVMLSRRIGGNTVINYKTLHGSDGSPLEREIPLTYENWNIHWGDGSPGNEEMWSLLTSCIIRTYCLGKRRIAIHCWGGYGRTCSALFLTLMIKVIYKNPSERERLYKMCEDWFKDITHSESKIKKYVNTLFKTYGLFNDNDLIEFDTSSGKLPRAKLKTRNEYNKLIRSINSGRECGDNCINTHNESAKIRRSEVLESSCLKSRMDFIMQQILYVLEVFSDDPEVTRRAIPRWNPYIRELYQFLKLRGVVGVKQPQQRTQPEPQPVPQQFIPPNTEPIPHDLYVDSIIPVQNDRPEGSPSLPPPGGSPSLPPPEQQLGWREWGMGYLNAIGNQLGINKT